MPFISDADLTAVLDKAGLSEEASKAILDVNQQARLDGLRAALVVLAAIALLALFAARRIPTEQPGSAPGSVRVEQRGAFPSTPSLMLPGRTHQTVARPCEVDERRQGTASVGRASAHMRVVGRPQ